MAVFRTAFKINLSFLAFVLAAILFVPVGLRADETVRWGRFDFPPFEISDGPFKNGGIVDIIKNKVQNGLENYRHEDAGLMNYERLLLKFKTEDVCHGALVRTQEAEKFAYLSIGVGIMPSHVLIVSAVNGKEKFDHQKPVSLRRIIEKGVSLGVPSRTMGPVIDSIVEEYKDRKNVHIRKTLEIGGLFKMLATKRFDCAIGYPAEAVYWNNMNPENRLALIPLEENFEQYTIGRVSCSKNEWGRKIIEEVNEILLKHRTGDGYIEEVFLPWITEEMKEEYLIDYNKIIAEDSWSNAR